MQKRVIFIRHGHSEYAEHSLRRHVALQFVKLRMGAPFRCMDAALSFDPFVADTPLSARGVRECEELAEHELSLLPRTSLLHLADMSALSADHIRRA